MDREQEEAVLLIEKGHNLVLLGQAGTGKTYTIKECVKSMKEARKNVRITCYTGVACLQYKEAQTLHKFAGLEDGRHHKSDLLNLISADERFLQARRNILDTDCLIVDEASMVSAKILNNVEYLCRHIRKVDTYFGGMQIVLVGDVFQLPPIVDELNGDYGKHFFEIPYFTKVFPHAVLLKSIHRQQEEDLITAVNELEMGCPSEETNNYLYSLNRPLTGIQSQIVKLFARNLEADVYNASMLQNIGNPLEIFTAIDHGDSYYLKKILAPKILALKKGCKIMLLKNLSDKLVNGLIGTVQEISRKNSQIIVEFCIDDKNIITPIDMYTFTKVDPESNLTLCQRQQFPLRLAYGITIHKSQGMTIRNLEVDCKYAHHPGQLGVAIGRAVCSDGLRVLNYHPSLCQKHPQKVYEFHGKCSEDSVFIEDLSCCHPSMVSNESSDHRFLDFDELETILQDSDEEQMDLSESFMDIVEEFPSARSDIISTFKEAIEDYMGTPLQKEIQAETERLLKEKKVNEWYDDQRRKVLSILDSARPKGGKGFENKHFTDFYTKFDSYINSEEYLSSVLVRKEHPMNRNVTTSVLFTIQKHVLKEESKLVDIQDVELNVFPHEKVEISSGGLGKIRYIGGYTVAKCKYRISKTMRNSLYLPALAEEVKRLQDQVGILDNMSACGEVSSDYQDTLEETERKQNIRRGLTHITDVSFKFFEFIEIKTRQLLKYSTLYEYRRELYHYVLDTLLTDMEIYELFVKLHDTCPLQSEEQMDVIENICNSLVLRVQNLEIVFKLILSLYVKVSVSQFRKDLVQAIKLEKTKALRKRVGEKKKKKQEVKFNYDYILSDISPGKEKSHMQLKSKAMLNEPLLHFSKNDLLAVAKLYGLKISTRSTVEVITKTLFEKIKSCDSMPNTAHVQSTTTEPVSTEDFELRDIHTCESVLSSHTNIGSEEEEEQLCLASEIHSEPQPSTSGSEVPCHPPTLEIEPSKLESTSIPKRRGGKRKGRISRKKSSKRRQTNDEVDVKCKVCMCIFIDDNEDSICCDSCDLWFHRKCVGLQDEKDWEAMSNPTTIYTCPLCI